MKFAVGEAVYGQECGQETDFYTGNLVLADF